MQEGQSVPKNMVNGESDIAEKIMQKAIEYDAPLFQNEEFVKSLIDLKTRDKISPSLYRSAAELFFWIQESEQNAQISL